MPGNQRQSGGVEGWRGRDRYSRDRDVAICYFMHILSSRRLYSYVSLMSLCLFDILLLSPSPLYQSTLPITTNELTHLPNREHPP